MDGKGTIKSNSSRLGYMFLTIKSHPPRLDYLFPVVENMFSDRGSSCSAKPARNVQHK